MSRLDDAAEIVTLAGDLGLGSLAKPVEAVVGFCLRKIDGWVQQVGGVASIAALEALVTNKLQMVFEEVRSDADFDCIKEQYARAKKDPVFATMRLKFDDADNPTYGALVKRKNAPADAPDRYVAVIDCRGSKAARRFFTRWHEVGHRLTTHADGGATEPGYRSEHDPIERLMDEIAGHVGYYGPLFDSVFQVAHRGKKLLLFNTVEAVIRQGFPDASFQATLNACTRQLPTPLIYLEAALGHKAVVKREIEDDSPRLFAFEEPPPDLRAVRVVANEAAQGEKFVIPQNMRVPESSVIRSLFEAHGERDAASREDLGHWSDSKGKRLERRAVAVEARKVADRVIAIVQPVEPVRPRPQRPKVKGLFEE
jgi:hypothetical protein